MSEIGSEAPPIKVGKWLKNGIDIEGLIGTKAIVLEFWAFWCPPCIRAIPHINKLSQQFQDIVFIGMTSNRNDLKQSEDLVEKMKNDMDYHIAIDDEDGTTDTNYMKKFGVSGIPHCFFISKEGKILWHGHPMELDPVLDVENSDISVRDFYRSIVANDNSKILEVLNQSPEKAKTIPKTLIEMLVEKKNFVVLEKILDTDIDMSQMSMNDFFDFADFPQNFLRKLLSKLSKTPMTIDSLDGSILAVVRIIYGYFRTFQMDMVADFTEQFCQSIRDIHEKIPFDFTQKQILFPFVRSMISGLVEYILGLHKFTDEQYNARDGDRTILDSLFAFYSYIPQPEEAKKILSMILPHLSSETLTMSLDTCFLIDSSVVDLCISAPTFDVHAKTQSGQTVLHLAVQNKMNQIVAKVISMGANVNEVDGDGASPLHYCNASSLPLLLDAGADPKVLNSAGKNFFESVATHGLDLDFVEEVKNRKLLNSVDFVKGIIRDKRFSKDVKQLISDENIKATSDLLLAAAESGAVANVLFLLSQGADPNAKNSNQSNLLHLSAQHATVDEFKSLVSLSGLQLTDEKDDLGWNVFHYAGYKSNKTLYAYLKEELNQDPVIFHRSHLVEHLMDESEPDSKFQC
ncbi:thiol:disulfide interchange protein dsbe [Anaeramoeba ignava]|uniref:Thiol:disulfide interchange protein dsbe n=1 Tax=Anaeramoeba ignava TaxID=1746090 RepID=A0A9Q0LND3_ANAIG|nr:thiol:disulfide interchange protein dsbe [Anaeramoeba ignava]